MEACKKGAFMCTDEQFHGVRQHEIAKYIEEANWGLEKDVRWVVLDDDESVECDRKYKEAFQGKTVVTDAKVRRKDTLLLRGLLAGGVGCVVGGDPHTPISL